MEERIHRIPTSTEEILMTSLVLCVFTGLGSLGWLLCIFPGSDTDNLEVIQALWLGLYVVHFWYLSLFTSLPVVEDYTPFLNAPQYQEPNWMWFSNLSRTKFHRRITERKGLAVARNLGGFVFFMFPLLGATASPPSAWTFVAIVLILVEAFQIACIYRIWKLYHAFFNCTCVFAVAASCRLFGPHHLYTVSTFCISLGFIFLRGLALHFDYVSNKSGPYDAYAFVGLLPLHWCFGESIWTHLVPPYSMRA